MSIKTSSSTPHLNSNPDRTAVAHDVFTYCTKEKHETWHVVRNHNAHGLVERVVCKACGSEHKYKSTRAAATPARSGGRNVLVRSANGAGQGTTRTASSALARSSPSTSSSSSSKAAVSSAMLEEDWFRQVKSWGTKPVRPYAPSDHHVPREVLEHEVFGKGVVQTRRENRIDVLFRLGMKTLPSKP